MAGHESLVPPEVTGGTPEERFLTALRAVAGAGIRVAGPEEAAAAVLSALEHRRIEAVVAWADPLLKGVGLPQAARARGIEWYTAAPDRDPGEIRVRAARAGAGVTGADWGLAETGSLVLLSGPGRPRSVSLLPPVHIAVLPVERLLPDTGHLLRIMADRFRAGGLPSSVNFVTGPSRTADIEHISVRKVHGPGELLVVLAAGL